MPFCFYAIADLASHGWDSRFFQSVLYASVSRQALFVSPWAIFHAQAASIRRQHQCAHCQSLALARGHLLLEFYSCWCLQPCGLAVHHILCIAQIAEIPHAFHTLQSRAVSKYANGLSFVKSCAVRFQFEVLYSRLTCRTAQLLQLEPVLSSTRSACGITAAPVLMYSSCIPSSSYPCYVITAESAPLPTIHSLPQQNGSLAKLQVHKPHHQDHVHKLPRQCFLMP